jgi:glycosyltransferase involved in cell wall biosynthesis
VEERAELTTIAVNARRLSGQALGVSRYIEYLARYWQELLTEREEAIFYLSDPLAPGRLPVAPPQRTEVLDSRLRGVLWENAVLARAARSASVLFGPGYTLPLTFRGRSVVAIHSVNEIWPGSHPYRYRLSYGQLYRWSARHATRVIVPSRSTLEDLQELYRVPAEKIAVVLQGADEAFRPLADEQALSETRRRWLGEDRPFAVFVGKLSQRRNIPILIRAFAEAKRRAELPHALLLFGPNHLGLPLEDIVARAGVTGSVFQDDGLVADHGELALVYNAADLYVSASSYEGFSLTLVEAMACGTPAVAVDRAAQREIAAEAALLVPDATVEALAEAISWALSDGELRRDLRDRGLKRARLFRWKETARQTLEVLREVVRE